MKLNRPLLFLLCLSLFACDSKETPEEGPATYKVLQGGPCGSITYWHNFGNDYDSALEGLIKWEEEHLTQSELANYYVDAEIITVDFNDDDRVFYYVTFRKKKNDTHITSGSVLDSYGNHYYINWCDD
jgi:hypothetical protein